MFINIFSNNKNKVYEQFYYVATICDPKLGPSSGYDLSIGKYRGTKFHKLQIFPCHVKNTLQMYVKSTRVKLITKRPKDVQ